MVMSEKLFILFIMLLKSWALCAYDFKAVTIDGCELAYNILTDSTVEVTYTSWIEDNYADITCDVIHIPDSVCTDSKCYRVIGIRSYSFADTKTIKQLYIPSAIDTIGAPLNYHGSIENFIVHSDNSKYMSDDGIIYTKDKQKLVQYPPSKLDSIYSLPEGLKSIGSLSFHSINYLHVLEAPLSLEKLDILAMMTIDTLTHTLRELVFQDSLRIMDGYSLMGLQIRLLVLGSGLEEVDFQYFPYKNPVDVVCRATTPPICHNGSSQYLPLSTLHVPRKSIGLYQKANGWSRFGTILPIEPPIITGINTTDISWVQNFSATGYVWTLYLDEAQTQQFMQLTFDSNGRLTGIDIRRTPALSHTADEADTDNKDLNNRRYAEYYSFTISGLAANTTYYYTCQSLAGDEVIDEDSGSFRTLQTTMINTTDEDNATLSVRKHIHNGNIQILLPDGRRFDATGREIK